MHIEVDTELVAAAALRAVTAAAGLRALAGETARVTETVHDPAVASGLAALADVVADACEVLALDLELIGRRLRAGAGDYAATENRLVGAADGDEAGE